MAAETGISWADSTANLWTGCTEVSPACDHCYARVLMADRFKRVIWGAHGDRVYVAQGWKDLRKWQRAADRNGGIDPVLGRRRRVFINSVADFFDNHRTIPWRGEAWDLFRQCPSLDIMILTKRPQNIEKMLPPDWGEGWPNIWLGITVEDQTEADRRAPILAAIPAALRFISAEPLLSAVRIPTDILARYSWLIVGGESGDDARPTDPDHAYSLMFAAALCKLALHFKQWGEWMPVSTGAIDPQRVIYDGQIYEGDRYTRLPSGQSMIRIGTANSGYILRSGEYRGFPLSPAIWSKEGTR